MKRNRFSWFVLIVFSLIFVASVSHADVLAIRGILGLSDDTVSHRPPVARFAIDRPYDTPRPFSTDEIVGNAANDSFVLIPPASNEDLEAFPSSSDFAMLLVILTKGTASRNDVGATTVPADLLRVVNGLVKDCTATTIVMEVMVPGRVSPQVRQNRLAGDGVRLISPEPAAFQASREPVSIPDYSGQIEISRARGPVK